ncbi:type I polyketide synthase [Streptomyces chrestomyceticus]|uniref:type I polyketide synthase n=1 Tax=Streptomyces chrestomyceticus TaxID=68185 RepID=UPI003405230B
MTTSDRPVAVVGAGCRLPGGVNSLADLWRLLVQERDVVGVVPPERWTQDELRELPAGVVRRMVYGGYLDGDVCAFDAAAFGMNEHEAQFADPQHRLLWEVAWEALEHSGMPVDGMARMRVGQYYGSYAKDYLLRTHGGVADCDPYKFFTAVDSMMTGRLGFLLDLRGPGLVVEGACASSLLAVHAACQGLRAGEVDVALAGGTQLSLAPEMVAAFAQWEAYSPTGRSRPFDADADGFARAEGCAVVVLKRLVDALRDGDRVLAVLRGSAVGVNGAGTRLTAPSVEAQAELYRLALERAAVDPRDVGMLEAHGTGTPTGDPVEFASLAQVYGSGRDRCALGSVKSNIGHAEAASGVTGLLKSILALQHEAVPATLHFKRWNPLMQPQGTRFFVPTSLTAWPVGSGARLAAVSSFGATGSNGHLIVEAPPTAQPSRRAGRAAPVPVSAAAVGGADQMRVFTLSGRTLGTVREGARRLAQWLQDDGAGAPLHDVAHTLAVRRSPASYRAAVVAGTRAELLERLRTLQDGHVVEGVVHGPCVPGAEQRGPVWVFAGHGSQWEGMCRGLLDADPAFTAVVDELEPLVMAESGFSLRHALTSSQEGTPFDQVQPLLFTVQLGLAAMWRSWGVQPAAIIGHSMGETAAAVAAGALSLEDGVRVICRRSRVIRSTAGQGLMASVNLGSDEVEHLLRQDGAADVSVAVINAPHLTVIGGRAGAVRALMERWQAQGISVRLVNVDVASHTARMEPLKDELIRALADLRPRKARVPFYTTALNDPRAVAGFDAAYWFANQRNPARFAPAVRAAFEDGYRLFVELGPHPLLNGAIRASAGGQVAAVASLERDRDEPSSFLGQLAALHTAGGRIDWSRHYGSGDLVDVPATTWERQHLTVQASSRSGGADAPGGHPLVGAHVADPDTEGRHLWQTQLDPERVPWLADHTFNGPPVLFATAYVEMCLRAATDLYKTPPERIRVCGLRIHRALAVARAVAVTAQANVVGPDRALWTLETGNTDDGRTRHADARLLNTGPGDAADRPPGGQTGLDALLAAHPQDSDPQDFYTDLRDTQGVTYGPALRGLRSLHWKQTADGTSILARYELPDAARAASHLLHCHPVVLDTAGQAAVAVWRRATATDTAEGNIVVSGIQEVRVHGALPTTGWVHAVLDNRGEGSAGATARLLSDDGAVTAELTGIAMVSVPTSTAEERLQSRVLDVRWSESMPPAQARTTASAWLLLHTGAARRFAEELAACLAAAGARTTVARCDAGVPAAEPLLPDGSQDELGVVFLPGTASAHDGGQAADLARQHVTRLVHLAQALTTPQTTGAVRLWVLTRDAVAVRAGEAPNLSQAGLRGALRTLGYEHPRLMPTLLDTDVHTPVDRIARELLDCPGNEDQIAYRQGRRLLARLTPAPLSADDRRRVVDLADENTELVARTIGDLDSLELVAASRRPPGPGEVEIRVHATGMNFSNVSTATGVYQVFASSQAEGQRTAFDCAGTVSAVGQGVSDLQPGDRVAAVVAAQHFASSYATVSAGWRVLRVPDGMSLNDAAALPMAYLTAWYGLRHLAHLQAGERVLIHCASGGMGLAAVNVARLCGAEVWATAGTESKRGYLRDLGIAQVLNSRTPNFADDIRRITGGQGVDVVWNCLAGPAQAAGVELLAPGGRFLELGKKDIYAGSRLSLLPFGRALAFHTLYPAWEQSDHPHLRRVSAQVAKALHHNLLPALPVTAYPVTEAATAYQTMAQARHTGKLVLTWPDEREAAVPVPPQNVPQVRSDGSYLITGGFGGLGLLTARWLCERHAGTVILTSRADPTPETARELARLRRSGTRIEAVPGDIAAPGTAEVLVRAATATGHRLRGVLHAAAVIEDATLTNLTPALIDRVWHPKAAGTWRLHQATAGHDPDWWVAYSSAASTLGNGGQIAYASANAWLEEFVSWRRAQGLPAACIAWGPWAEVGAGTQMQDRGYDMIDPDEGMEALRRFLTHDRVRATYTPTDYHHWLQADPAAGDLHYFGLLLGTAPGTARAERTLVDALADCSTDTERHCLLQQAVITHTAAVLHHDPAAFTGATAFNAVGLDSLMSTSLRNKLEHDTGLRIPPSAVWAQQNPADLAHYLLQQLTDQSQPDQNEPA